MSMDFNVVADAKGVEIRWQHVRINQFTVVNQSLIGFSMTAIGFLQTTAPDHGGVAIGLLALSVLCGTCCAIVRLMDFRITARIARLKRKKRELSTEKRNFENGCRLEEMLKKKRTTAKCLGRDSWTLLKGQVGAFLLGFIAAIVTQWAN